MNQQQVLALLSANAEGDHDRFRAVALQVAADAARKGRPEFSERIKRLAAGTMKPLQLSPAAQEVLLEARAPFSLGELVLDAGLREAVRGFVLEWKERERLRARGIEPRRRVLAIGPPGTGKTVTAGALARELGLPFYVARLDAIIDSYLGKTGKNLGQLFDSVRTAGGVYFLDEFDALAARRVGRTGESDVGEMRRALNCLLQYLEEPGAGIVVAATNLDSLLDEAVFRRFDLVLEFRMPEEAELRELVRRTLGRAGIPMDDLLHWNGLREDLTGQSHATAVKKALDLARRLVLAGEPADPALARPAAE